eukprot:9129652-Alexandrium_andersonii.AAC.1
MATVTGQPGVPDAGRSAECEHRLPDTVPGASTCPSNLRPELTAKTSLHGLDTGMAPAPRRDLRRRDDEAAVPFC